MNLLPILAALSGQGVVNAIVWLIVAGVIFWLLSWLIAYVSIPEPFAKVAKVVLAIAAVVVVINVLLTLAGYPLIRW